MKTVDEIIRAVSELPDRNSPEGQPEMMLVTGDELREIIEAALKEREGYSVATVLWYDPALDVLPRKAGKIIDASMAFFDSAPIGTPLYTAPHKAQPMSDEQERSSFEAWLTKRHPAVNLAHRVDGSYWSDIPDSFFDGWMARAKLDGIAAERHHGIGE